VLGLVPHTPGTPLHPGALSGNDPTPNFWTPLWASCSLTIQPLLFVSHLFSSPFSHCPLVPMSQYKPLSIRLTHTCSPQMDVWPFRCTSPPITTHMTPSYNSKRDSPFAPLRARLFYYVSPLFSHGQCVSPLLTLIVILSGITSTIRCK
jgi:hypothetical protein